MNSAIADGFKLMWLGMGMVFLFLLAMIFFIVITSLILKLIQYFFPKETALVTDVPNSTAKNLIQNKDLVNVLSQAITTYKADKLK